MPEEIHALKIGEKLRARREQQGLTTYDLSQKCDLSEARLMAFEEGYATPTISVLLKIAQVLGVGMGFFFQDVRDVQPVDVVRADKRIKVSREKKEGLEEGLYYTYEALMVNFPGAVMKPFHIEIEVTDHTKVEAAVHRGQEFIFVLEGQVEWRGSDETYLLSAGDSIYFNSEIPHKIVGVGKTTPRALAVIYEPPGAG